MTRRLRFVLTSVVALAGVALVPPPAQAAPHASTIAFNAHPEPIAAGSSVTLSGKAGYGSSGNAAAIRFYFRRFNATSYTLIASTTATSSGAFSKTAKQTTSGYWKAVYAGNSARRPATSSIDYVEARAWRNVPSTRFSRSGTGDYKSAVLSWYTDRAAKVTVRETCAEASEYNFIRVHWTGHPTWGADSASFDFTGTSTSGSSYIYPDEKTGYIEVTTQDGCSWTVTITQTVRAYVKV